MHRAVIIFNPIAGGAVGRSVAADAESQLRAAGFEVRSVATRDRSGATGIAKSVASEVELMVVAGGDGTLREAIEGLGERAGSLTLGFLPIGNANVAAQELGIPTDPASAVRVLTEGVPALVDIARLRTGSDEKIVLAVVGIGWDAATVHLLDRLRHSRIGRLWYRLWADSAYLICGLLAACRLVWPRFRLEVDGRLQPDSFCAAHLCNFRSYGKGMAVTPEAHFQSGLLHYQARRRASPLALLLHLAAAQMQRRAPSFVSSYGEGHRLVLSGERAVSVQVDGDYLGERDRLELELKAAAIRILVPAPPLDV